MPKVHFNNRGEINAWFAMLDFTGVVLASGDDDSIQWRLSSVDGKFYFCEGEASGAFAGQEDTTCCDAEGVWQFNVKDDGALHGADGWYCTACVLEMLANGDMVVKSGAIKVGGVR